MKNDSIVAEVRKNRREILKSYDWNFEKMSREMMKKQWKSGHKVVSLPSKKIKEHDAPNAYPMRNFN